MLCLCVFRMNPNAFKCRTGAFTLVEMLTVIAIIAILAALLLPVLNKGELRSKRIVCINDLQQIGLAFHVFSNDHSGKFPMAVSTNEGGSLEYVESGFDSGPAFYTAFYHFQALSGELVKPQLLICPADLRVAATNFPALQNENVSYFVGVDGTFDKPGSILAGDRNLATNSFRNPTILQIGPQSRLGWTWELHHIKGNVLFSDGHVEEWNNSSLAAAASQSSGYQSLFLPSVVMNYDVGSGGDGNGGGSGGGSSGQGGGSSSGSPGQSDGSLGNSGSGSIASSGGSSGNSSSGPAAQSGATSASQPMQSQGSSSANKPLYAMRTDTEPSPTTEKAQTTPTASTEVDDTTVSPGASPDSGMSTFDRHLMKTLQHTFEWIYLLLLLLLLVYLAYKLRQRAQRRAARQRNASDSFR